MEDTVVNSAMSSYSKKSLENLTDEQLLENAEGTLAASPSVEMRRRMGEEKGEREGERDELSPLRYSGRSYRSMLQSYAEKNTPTVAGPPIWAPVMREVERERSRSAILHSGVGQGPDDLSLARSMDFEVWREERVLH